jgi:hypothetical protein
MVTHQQADLVVQASGVGVQQPVPVGCCIREDGYEPVVVCPGVQLATAQV